MIRFFACLASFALLTSVSFGALIVSYPITSAGGLGPTVDPAAALLGFSATTGVRNTLGGSVSGGTFTTGTTSATSVNSSNYAIFSLSNSLDRFALERIEFVVRTSQGTGSLVISSDGSTPAFSNFSATGAVTSSSFVTVPISYNVDALVSGGKSMTWRLYTVSSDGSPFTAVIDSIDVYGKIVPEPASIAVFGGLSSGLLFLRRRRLLV